MPGVFTSDCIAELLLEVITAAISTLDRYIHDQIVTHCLKLLSRPEGDIPKELRPLKLPALPLSNLARLLTVIFPSTPFRTRRNCLPPGPCHH